MHMTPLTAAHSDAYRRFLLDTPESLFYQGPAYLGFLQDLLGCESETLLAMEGEAIRGVLPLMALSTPHGRILNSLPYYGSNGGVLAATEQAEQALLEAYREIATRPDTLASTLVTNPLRPHPDGVVHTLTDRRIGQLTDLSEAVPLGERIDPSARRNVRKALSQGISVTRDASQLSRLMVMHQENMAAIGGRAKTERFFALIPEHFTEGEDYDVYVARYDGQVIAGLLVFYFNRTVEYFTPATDAAFRSLQPLPLIVWTAMGEAAARGFRWWNWGGTWTTQEGVYRFKKKWAALERPYDYYTQLNERALLEWPAARLLEQFPYFYVVPFSALAAGTTV